MNEDTAFPISKNKTLIDSAYNITQSWFLFYLMCFAIIVHILAVLFVVYKVFGKLIELG